MQESIVFLVRVQYRRKESSRSLSHLLMSFLSESGRKNILVSGEIKSVRIFAGDHPSEAPPSLAKNLTNYGRNLETVQDRR